MKTYYTLLRVSKQASLEEIKSAYRSLASRYHPDVNSDPDAGDIFKLINRAYNILSDPDKRRDYDNLISNDSIIRTRSDDQVLESSGLFPAISNLLAVIIFYTGLALGATAFVEWLAEIKPIFWSSQTVVALIIGILFGGIVGFNANFQSREIFGKGYRYYRILFWLLLAGLITGVIWLDFSTLRGVF